MPVTEQGGTARILAKVAIVLPAELFYLAEPTALAFPALLGLVTFLSAQDPAAGRVQLVIFLLGNLVGSVAAAAASAVLEVGPPLPALTLMALLGSLGFAAAPVPFDVPVLDRIVDIFVLSLYTVGATTLLLPSPDPMAGHGGPLGGQFA